VTTSLFIPHARLERLVDDGTLEVAEARLTLATARATYRTEEAVRVLREVASGDDPHRLVGTVQPRHTVTHELGGELLGDSLLVEDSAYEVVAGVLAVAIEAFEPGASGVGERATWSSLAARHRRV
jgi:hypothetical protein